MQIQCFCLAVQQHSLGQILYPNLEACADRNKIPSVSIFDALENIRKFINKKPSETFSV